ncbi:MAG: phosphorylase [Janthinobacterium lividum]
MILVACGLLREARLIARPGIEVVAGGGDDERLERELDTAAGRASAIASIGLAGGLLAGLRPGDWIVDCADTAWRGRLLAALPTARSGPIVGSMHAVATAAGKRELHVASGACAVDMETHVAARVAARHGLAFASVRVVSDAADDDLPPAALVGMRPDGGIDLGAVLRSLARHPAQLPALLRTGRNAEKAFRALKKFALPA